jgi:hypothetical protein
MAGTVRGPAPKRDADRENRNPKHGGDALVLGPDELKSLPFDIELLVEPPPADPKWEPGALQIYEATLRDPARIWMGPVDWATHWFVCENLSRELAPQYVATVEGGVDVDTGEQIAGHVVHERMPIKGATLTACLKWLAMIGVGESSRLALRREVTFHHEAKVELADVTDITPTREGFFQDGGR